MPARWTALARCFDDGRLALDNNPAERALRCVAIGRKNYLFAGSDAGRSAGIPVYLEIRYRFFCNTRLVVSKYRRATQSNWNRKASTELVIRVLFAPAFTASRTHGV
jgi:hypothetical protein